MQRIHCAKQFQLLHSFFEDRLTTARVFAQCLQGSKCKICIMNNEMAINFILAMLYETLRHKNPHDSAYTIKQVIYRVSVL